MTQKASQNANKTDAGFDPEMMVAREDIPEAGLKKGDWIIAPIGCKPHVVRPWLGNPGLLLNLACDKRLQFAGEDGLVAPPLRITP
jgi:hypothetical protein